MKKKFGGGGRDNFDKLQGMYKDLKPQSAKLCMRIQCLCVRM